MALTIADNILSSVSFKRNNRCGHQRRILNRSRGMDRSSAFARIFLHLVRKGAAKKGEHANRTLSENVGGIQPDNTGEHAGSAIPETGPGHVNGPSSPYRPSRKKATTLDERLNIIIIVMFIAVLGMLFWVHSTIQVNTRAMISVQEKQFKNLLDIQTAQYNEFKTERDLAFNQLKEGVITLLNANLQKIKEDEARILANLDEQLLQQSSKVQEVAKKVEEQPAKEVHTIERHTEIISDGEQQRRDKLREQWSKYHKDKTDWDRKFGPSRQKRSRTTP